jgi:Ca2+-binding RTX toxin-like protein
MGILTYRDFDTKSLMTDVMAINRFMYDGLGLSEEMDSTPETYNPDGAWRMLKPEEISYSGTNYTDFDHTYHGELFVNWGVQVSVLGKYDEQGKLTNIGLSFWGTSGSPDDPNLFLNTLSDMLTYGLDILGPENAIHSYIYHAFNGLLNDIVNFATENGLTGKDMIISGHSQGGLCVNSMASGSALGKWGGFFEDSAYIALASPTQNNLDDKVLNFGLENDPVYRLAENDSLTSESLFIHDKPLETCTNNLVSFNDFYAHYNIYSILNSGFWENGHAPLWYEKTMNAILDSEYYGYTNLNSTIIVASLSDEMRASTWVQDLNYFARPHEGPTFIVGTDKDDLIKGGRGIDYLEGNAGDDTFRDTGGYNFISGGEGNDTFDTQTQFDFWSWTQDSNGNLWARDRDGNVSILNSVEQIVGGYHGWFGIGWNEINGTVTRDGIAFTYEGKSGFKAWDNTAQASLDSDSYVAGTLTQGNQSGFLFGYEGNDTLVGTLSNEVFAAGQGDDIIYTNGGKDIVMVFGEDFGHDTIYNFSTDDKLVFMGNSLIEDQNSLWQYVTAKDNDLYISFNDECSITLVGCANTGLDDNQLIAA